MDRLFEIKKAKRNDIPLILSFIKKLAEYEKLNHEVSATEEILDHSLFGESRHAECIIGYFGGEPVGFALFFHNFSTFKGKAGLYLEDIFVIPEMRGKGFGRKLFAYVAEIAVQRDCPRLEWSVLDWNKPAIDFYLDLGAVALNDWTTFRLSGKSLKNFNNNS